jgi:hypothetical protein
MEAHTLSLIISKLPLQNVKLALGIGDILLIQVVISGILKAVGLHGNISLRLGTSPTCSAGQKFLFNYSD